jgi:CheY-like chemotaxis protein
MLRGREAILLVEDDEALQRVTRRVLGAVGYHVLTAQNAADALRILARSEEKIDLLLTDVVMPGMSGVDLASRALRERPTLRVLYTSGYAENEALRRGIADGRMPFLAKPYSVIELTRRIREVLDA